MALPPSEDISHVREEGKHGARTKDRYDVLAETLLLSALEFFVLSRLPSDFMFLDAGGSAGGWSHEIALGNPGSAGVLYNRTPHTLAQAEAYAAERGYADRVRYQQGEWEEAADILSGQRFHLLLNHHLGFVREPARTISSLAVLLADGGLMVSVVPSRWHAASVNLGSGRLDAAERSLAGCDGFTDDPPHLFTSGEIRSIHNAAGLDVDLVTGFPNLVGPGAPTAWMDASSVTSTESLLGDDAVFQRVLRMERELLIDPDAVGRGANLFVVASPHIPN